MIDHTEDVRDSSDSEVERDDEDQGFVSRQDNQPSDEDLQLSPTSSNDTNAAASVEPPPLKPASECYHNPPLLLLRHLFPYVFCAI